MRNIWIRFGCFLTGYNYKLVKASSEVVTKTVLRYTAALLIIMPVWAFIGATFTLRYLHGTMLYAILAAALMVFIVVQIERQIILVVHGKSGFTKFFRIAIGIVMAILGSVILDQYIFKDDIDKTKITTVEKEVQRLLPIKVNELNNQLADLQGTINSKEEERINLVNDINKSPVIASYQIKTDQTKDEASGKMVSVGRQVTTQTIENPKIKQLAPLNDQIQKLYDRKVELEKKIIDVRVSIENELKSKTGFLDELKIMFEILTSHWISMSVWILLFLFFLMIELFVIVSKFTDVDSDYEKIILSSMENRKIMIDKHAKSQIDGLS